jgi:DNA-binding MarR family transcriptional regulator
MPHSRDESLEAIQRELTAFARRARATAARLHPELTLVSFTLLSHLEEQQGCRATDLAAHYMLDKSTVSRQVTALERLGFVERRPDPADQRVRVLHPTRAGHKALAVAHERRRQLIRERLADWAEEDLSRFAEYLVRYTEASSAVTPPSGAPRGEEDASGRCPAAQPASASIAGPRAAPAAVRR